MDARTWFTRSSDGALTLIRGIRSSALDEPGLGEWTVRELIAHTARAWTTVTEYLAEPPPEGPTLSAAEYLARGVTLAGVHAGVAERARADAARVTDPAAHAGEAAASALVAIDGVPDDRPVATRIGPVRLGEYLRTRAFELTVHSLDLACATGVEPGAALAACGPPALALVTEVAAERGLTAPLLLAATGRQALPADFTLLG